MNAGLVACIKIYQDRLLEYEYAFQIILPVPCASERMRRHVDWIELAQNVLNLQALVTAVMKSRFIYQTSNYQLLRRTHVVDDVMKKSV